MSNLDIFLSRWQWYRRWRGGHWECWYLDVPVAAMSWFHNEPFATNGTRPGLGRGTPIIEDY